MMRHAPLLLALFLGAALAAPTRQDGGWISMGPSGKPHTEQQKPSPTPSSTTRQFSELADLAASLRNRCSDANQCSFLEKFGWKNDARWTNAHDYTNDAIFNSWWSNDMVEVDTGREKMRLAVAQEERHGKPYKSGQMQTHKWHGYGCYEVRMKPPRQEGLVSTFFTYTGKYDAAPGKPKEHNEVDLEFVYKRRQITLQANYFTNGKGGNEHRIRLKFNPTRKFHNYGFKWTSEGIEWYVDGKMLYSATKNTPKIEKGPHKIMMNIWPVNSDHSGGWGGKYVWRGKQKARYAGVRFTRGEECEIRNNFSSL